MDEPEIRKLFVLEREHILWVLAIKRGNRTDSARALGISIRCLRNKLARYRAKGHSVTEPEIRREPKP